jgi:capsular polysaccharide biosynthesis protein
MVTAIVGLILGIAVTTVISPKFTATSTLLLVHNPNDNPTLDMATDAAILDTATVAEDVIARLRLPLTADQLLADYQGVAISDAVLQVSLTAPSAAEAVERTNALVTSFLSVRTQLFQTQTQAAVTTLQNQVTPLEANVRSLDSQIAAAGPSSSTASLVTDRGQDLLQISQIQQTINGDEAATNEVIDGTRVLGTATLVKHSSVKRLAMDATYGLIGGLALGLGLVAIQTVVTDRLRRRDDIAAALRAPVTLSVGGFHSPRWMRLWRLSLRLGRSGKPVSRVARHLRGLLNDGPGHRWLAVVSIDSIDPATLAVCATAATLANHDRRVTLVDLSPDRMLSRLFGVRQPGAHEVSIEGATVPLRIISPAEADTNGDAAAEAFPRPERGETYASEGSEMTIVLLELRPGDNIPDLAEWANEAVVMVTAGHSTAARMRGVAELIRGGGLPITSVVLFGADRDDDTLGNLAPVT